MALPLRVAERDWLEEGVEVLVGVIDRELLALELPVKDRDCDIELLGDGVRDWDELGLGDLVPRALPEEVPLPLGEALGDTLGEALPLPVRLNEALCDLLPLWLFVDEGLGRALELPVAEAVVLGV